MHKYRPLFLLLIALFVYSSIADAQRRKRRGEEEAWPPARAYSRLFLGGALQDVFARHYDFCGFTKVDGKRDYTPPTIEKFLGKRSLRTRVEKADINGGNLLSYVFSAREAAAPLDAIHYRPGNLLFTEAEGINLLPEPREGFDAFVLTKNCAGYLKASLDAGFKPPYAAFAAALDTDARRSSSVLAMAGSFESPLAEVLGANDARTTELMARLWQYYREHPEYAAEAYYLRQFEGVAIKHLTDSEEVTAAEQSVGINVSLPLSTKLNSNLSHRRENTNAYTASDWETIVYTDFEGPYDRGSLFYRLPDAREVADYFAGLATETSAGVPLREAANHRHTVTVAGLPPELAGAGWYIDNVRGGAYGATPTLEVRAGEGRLNFTVAGHTASALFRLPGNEPVAVAYDLVLPAGGGLPALRIPVAQRMATSAHPLVELAGSRFELRRRNTGQYAFQWHLNLTVEDGENPLDGTGPFRAEDLRIGVAGDSLDARVVSVSYDQRRTTLSLVLESERSWPLRMIDDRNMRSFPLRSELCLSVREGYSVCRRPIEARLAVPRIIAPATAPQLPTLTPPSVDPAQG